VSKDLSDNTHRVDRDGIMYRNTRLTISVTFLGLFILSQHIDAQDSKTNRKADEDDIFALVIRSQMEQWIRDGDKSEAEAKDATDKDIAKKLNFIVFFVSINGADPSDAFMKRFSDLPRTIRKASSAVPDKRPHTPKDKSTGQSGIVFDVEDLKWQNNDLAEVQGGYYCGGLCAAGITFTVKRENGKWAIKDSHMNWIS
jgi:hypothetical protein